MVPPNFNYRGWHHLAIAKEIARGEVKTIRRFGQDVVLWRGYSGRITVADPVCPHLGAHLGHGGEVHGDCIRCPFHSWQFDPRGEVFHVPGAKSLPARAHLNIRNSAEVAGVILGYFDGFSTTSGEVPPVPAELVASLTGGENAYTTFRKLTLPADVEAIAENVPDRAHFEIVHRSSFKNAAPMDWDIHEGAFRVRFKSAMGPTRAPCESEIRYFDAFNMQAITRNTHTSDMHVTLMLAPIESNQVELLAAATTHGRHGFAAHITNRLFRRLAVGGIAQDAPIWRRKVTNEHPILSDADGPILPFRKWHRQFRLEQ